MPSQLKVAIGQHSDKGRKDINQDFHGACIPKEPLLSAKGIAIALADGISSSAVSQIASEAAVSGFLADYFCTSEAWSVKKSAQRVLTATNSWLHAQTRQSQYRYDKDRGYVCTLSAMVIKSTTAHIFHVGDTRIYRLRGSGLEQLTEDHRLWVAQDKSYLSRAFGIDSHLEIDYQALQLEPGDVFLFATDGIYEYASATFMAKAVHEHGDDLDVAAKAIVDEAYQQGSDDNLTVQILRIDELPEQQANERFQQLTELPFPPILDARMVFDGYTIVRELHASSRSHVYLALDGETNTSVIIKTPSTELQQNPLQLERFLTEEWIARRIDNAHVVKPCAQTRKRNFLYIVTEFIEGQTLTQWMIDHPRPDLQTVRGIVEQIAKGLRAFHRLEMLHQDLRPENIMIDATGTVKIVDFGSTRVTGLLETTAPIAQNDLLGTAQYSAPEYFIGESGSVRSDLFSLAVITYQMLTGRLPYGLQVAQSWTRAAQNKLKYSPIRGSDREIPAWIDDVLRKALHPSPPRRYQELSEFVFELRQPNQEFLNKARPPLVERNPVFFWKSVSLILAVVIVLLLSR
ncbi:MAG: bifunctional protein-serine/threonine kinase/phosphatase [Pseudomonas sp.]|uniref:protein kinase domain-containing protein n=1 Tax=Pseudomonas sp. TaxID=306 RepID=UPI003BB5840D